MTKSHYSERDYSIGKWSGDKMRIDTETIVQTRFVSAQDYSCDCCSSVFIILYDFV